ncbi:hypothetical protein Trydic_g5202 [Trypoxylus dichotomus]
MACTFMILSTVAIVLFIVICIICWRNCGTQSRITRQPTQANISINVTEHAGPVNSACISMPPQHTPPPYTSTEPPSYEEVMSRLRMMAKFSEKELAIYKGYYDEKWSTK